jgi:formate hydrogenlyase transcriptional activator
VLQENEFERVGGTQLQNIIERSLILCGTKTFSVDASWLVAEPPAAKSGVHPLSRPLPVDEKAMIEAALAETHGRVSGPSGAAIMLGLPASTLESKIRGLKINKHQFKAPPPDNSLKQSPRRSATAST